MGIKIVILGEGRVGKTSLLNRFVNCEFNEYEASSVSAAYLERSLTINGQQVRLSLWDTAGQERFHSLAPMYYRDALGALIVYDITDRESLEKAKRWLNELYTANRKDMIITLVGNKVDLEESRQVEKGDANLYAKEQQLAFFETSAKSGENIDELFTALGQKLIDQDPDDEEDNTNVVNVNTNPSQRRPEDDTGCRC